MIHTLLTLTRPLFVVDTETTGTDPERDRIVELGMQGYDKDGLQKEWRTLVNPGIPIPASATKVHGITDAMINGCRELMANGTLCDAPRDHMWHKESWPEYHTFKPWPSFKDLAPRLTLGFSNCDFAGQNVRFDLRILAAEFKRAGIDWSYAEARILDAGRLEQLALPRSLSHLHEKYVGKKHDGAHGALSDVRASTTVIVMQLEAHRSLPRDLDALHAAQWGDLIDVDSKFRFVDGVPTVMFGKHRGQSMKNVPVDYWDWLLKSDFPADVKRLASEAKLGRYPEK